MLLLPVHIRHPGHLVEVPCHDEQQVGQAVQELQGNPVDGFGFSQGIHPAFGAPADSAGMVTGGRRRAAAGQDEFLERRKIAVHIVEYRLQEFDTFGRDNLLSGQAQLTADIEQPVLYRCQIGPDRIRQVMYQQLPDKTVQFIDAANGLDPLMVLVDASAITQAGSAVISGTCIDFRKPVAHCKLF